MSFREWSRGVWAGVLGVVAVLAVVVGVSFAVAGDDGGADATASPQGSEQESPSATGSTTPTPEERPTPPPEIDYRAAAGRAAEGGLAPFVPDGRSWVVTAADYRDGAWQLVVEDGAATAQVVQTAGVAPKVLVSRHLDGARRGAPVNLGRWQLGEWSSWSAPGRHALTREFSHGVVVVTGDDAASVRAATQSLMTYESPRGGGEG